MTFCIIACCPESGRLGGAVSSAIPAVGSLSPYIRPGIGVVATQSLVRPYLAMGALDRMAAGIHPSVAIQALIEGDDTRDLQQLAAVSSTGHTAVWSGEKCIEYCNYFNGDGFVAVGNMLKAPSVIDKMASAFNGNPGHGDLAERLLVALEVGEEAGGDKRGRQSAALKIFGSEAYPLLDLRVDEHSHPIEELRRIMPIARLQLAPLIKAMSWHSGTHGILSDEEIAMLQSPPPKRPGDSKRLIQKP